MKKLSTLSIMQPTFLPWIGYFRLINISDHFVFLNDVQFEKQSWQSRNKIIINGTPKWVSINLVKSSLKSKINEIRYDNPSFSIKKIIKTFNQEYAKCDYKKDGLEVLNFLEDCHSNFLAETNIELIKFICKKFEFESKFYLSSDMKIDETRTNRIIKICDLINPRYYISTIGAKEYLNKDSFKNRSNIELKFFNYREKEYLQKNTKRFYNKQSIIDLISNLGWKNAKNYLNKNYEEITN